MIIVTYSQTGAHQISEEIWQYDRGQSLRIEGLPELPGEPWIQFSLNKTGGQTRDFPATVTDEGLVVSIPDDLLENNNARKDYALHVFVYQKGARSASTLCCISLPIHSRPRPIRTETQEAAAPADQDQGA